jgi:RNA polymerase sigma factor (sigma-70 family)
MDSESSAPRSSVLRTRGFDAFCIRYYERIRRYLYSELADLQLALDLTQETFASAFAASKKFRGRTPQEEWAWLKTIATNQLRGHWRAKYAYRAALRRLGPYVPSNDPALDRIEEIDVVERLPLAKLLQGLRPLDRRAIELRLYQGLSYKTMGERFDEQPDTMRMRVYRGLQELRRKLEAGQDADNWR